MSTTYRIEQKITMLANQYRVYRGDAPELIAFVHQKRFAMREKFELFADEARTQAIATVQARQVVDLAARYDVTAADGTKLGTVGKQFGQSLLRSTWLIWSPNGEDAPPLATVAERSSGLAAFRRIWEFLPVLSDIPFFVKYHFDFTSPSGEVIGSYNKTTTLYDHYALTASDQLEAVADWRLLVSMGIMLDALQSR